MTTESAEFRYPTGYDGIITYTQYEQMCAEIDRNSGNYEQWMLAEQKINDLETKMRADEMVRSAVASLTREITDHADTMRELLAQCANATTSMPLAFYVESKAAIKAYDEFIKEA